MGRAIAASLSSPAPSTFVLRLSYFLYFVAWGIYYPFIVPYLRELGLTGNEIGTAQMAGTIGSIPAALAWGVLSDRSRAPIKLLRAAIWVNVVVAFFMIWAKSATAIALVLSAQGLVAPAIIPLLDSVTMERVRQASDTSYSRVRVFGSLGFIVSAQGIGVLLTSRTGGDHDRVVPIAYTLGLAAVAITTSVLRASDGSHAPRVHFEEARKLLRDARLGIFLLAGAVHGATTSAYQLYGVLVRDDGLPPSITGAGMATGVAAEVLVLFAFPWLEQRLSLRALLAIAFSGTSLRWLLLSRSTGQAALVAIQALHGLTFGVYWAASIAALIRLVPPRLRTTGQAMNSIVTTYVAGAVGYRLAGFAYDRMGGARPVFGYAAAVELAAVLIVTGMPVVLERKNSAGEPDPIRPD